MAAISPDFEWFGFPISGLILNPDHLWSNLLLDSGFQVTGTYYLPGKKIVDKLFAI